MRKSFLSKFALFFLGLLMVFCHSCEPKQTKAPVPEKQPKLIETKQADTKQPEVKQAEAKQPEVKQPEVRRPVVKQPEVRRPVVKQPEKKTAVVEEKTKEKTAVKPAAGPSEIVAKISDYTITRGELEKRLMEELHPYEYEPHLDDGEPINAQTVLLKLIAEKAMIMDGREQNLLKNEMTSRSVKRFRERQLTNLLFKKYLEENLKVTESEIEEKIKAKPNLDRAGAKAEVEKAKANKLVTDYYGELYKKFNVRKLRENYPKVAEAHYRLLYRPKTERKMSFIRITQITTELTPEEQSLPLAVYDHGKVTLKDWFDALCEIVPPRRPRDLNTAKGVEQLLEGAMKMPIFVSEAELRGLDKDKDFLKQLRYEEDRNILAQARQEKYKEVKEPTMEERKIYYDNNKDKLRIDKAIKIDQIWCVDLETARKAKDELDGGKDFESVRQKYSLEKDGKALETDVGNEARFFEDLWKGDANDIMGPMKGFYRDEFKWRIVKILEKKPGKVKEYSDNLKNEIRWKIMSTQQQALMKKYTKELLEKYPYEIYSEKIKDIDPLNIP